MANFSDPTTISVTPGISINPANCVLWLDASDITTFYQLSTNTAPGYSTSVTTDGDPVGMWVDKSGSNHNFGVITTVNRPVYSLSSVYFDPSVTTRWLECIDENMYSYRNNTTDTLSGLTIFIVSELASTAATPRVLFTQLSSTGTAVAYNAAALTSPAIVYNSPSLQVWTKTTAARISNSSNSDYLTTINPLLPTITTVYTYNNLLQLMVGGNPTFAGPAGFGNGDTTIRRIRLGSDLNSFTAPTTPFFGRIREVIIYNIPLTFQQQKFVEAYLGEKWGAPYNAYPEADGNYDDPNIWFNNVVPRLSSATVLPNGFLVDITTSGVYPKLQTKRFTNWGWTDPGISKGGTFNINGTVDVVTERVWQDVPWGGLTRSAANGQIGSEAISPVISVPSGSTLNLSALSIQCLSYVVPALTASGTVNLNVPFLYGHSTSPVLRGFNNATININNATLAISNRWSSTSTLPGAVIAVYSGSTCTFNTCNLEENSTLLLPETSLIDRTNKCAHVYNNHATTIFNNCKIGSYGFRSQNSGSNSASTNTSEAVGAAVLVSSSGGNSTSIFNNCTLECANVNTATADKIAVFLFNPGSRGYFNNCVIRGSNFDTNFPAFNYGHAGIRIEAGALAEITNSTLFGGKGNGTYNNSTLRNDSPGSYPAAVKVTGSTSKLTLSACNVYGSSDRKAQAVHMNAGLLDTYNCSFYAGPDSNAINGSATTANISGPVIEDSFTGYRAIALPRHFINPVPKNAYLRYATDGTGVGFNAFTYQYTIDSLSAFSMPDVSAVRLGTPYAGGLLVGTAVIPPAEAVSYGTLVDNTTGSAILTLDLLNSFFQTPLTALAAPSLSGTIGYRIANTLTSNETIGHLIASFTTS